MARATKTEELLPIFAINVNGLVDILSGSTPMLGAKGEMITNGGVYPTTGLSSGGNNYKSLWIIEMYLTAMNRVCESHDTGGYHFDSEINFSKLRTHQISKKYKYLDRDLYDSDSPQIALTNKAHTFGDDWIDSTTKDLVETHKKEKKVQYTAFISPRTGKPYEAYVPTFMLVDSWSAFESKKTQLLEEDEVHDDGSKNTIFMMRGKWKNGILAKLTTYTSKHSLYFLNTAQLGDKGPEMDKYSKKRRSLQHMNADDKLKEVGSKYTYYMLMLWNSAMGTILKNRASGEPEYPATDGETASDLNIVRFTLARGKGGPSGYTIPQIFSQNEGWMPGLSELHYLRVDHKYFGMGGNKVHFHLTMYPDALFTRKSFREKIESEPRVKRAITLTSDIRQWMDINPNWIIQKRYVTEIKDLVKILTDKGYDWNILLESRQYGLIDQYNSVLPYLSGLDVLRMSVGEYVPYWLEKNKEGKYVMRKKYAKQKEAWDGL